MNSDRRSFFKTLGSAAAAAAAVSVPGINQAAVAAVSSGDGRAFNVQRNLLEIEGAPSGDLASVNGGYPMGIVVDDGIDQGGVMRKRLAGVKHKDLELSGGAGMGPKFFQLISDFLSLQSQTFNGAVSYSDAKFREGGRLDFTDAVVHSVRIPAMDASSKAVGHFGVTCRVGRSTREKGDGSKSTPPAKAKPWQLSNFRVSINGLESTMSLTTRVESLVIRQEIFPTASGAAAVDAGPLQIPDLVLTVSEQRSEPLYDWFENMVEKENPDERDGKIELLASDFQTVLFTINFFNLGIWWLATEDGDGSILRRVTAKMYCERMSFTRP